MLLERTLRTLEKINNPRLQLPIFYESPIALRFEIGDTALSIGDTRYFRAGQLRASFLYESIPKPDTLLWVLYRSPDTDSNIDALLERFCTLTRLPNPKEVYEQDTIDCDGEPLTRIFFFWDIEQTPPHIPSLLEGILKTDFAGFSELSSAVFFFHTAKHILLHLYDDRGMDIVAEKRETISFLYERFPNWLLDYDRKRMKEIFAPCHK